MRIRLLVLAAAAAAAAACGDSTSTPATPLPPLIDTVKFASSLNVNLSQMSKTADGLYFQDSVVGTGATLVAHDSLTVDYAGWLINGTEFDATTGFGHGAFSFHVGVGEVISGWDEGLIGMKVGGTRKLVIPPSLGYGDVANGPIPANSILVFNVTLDAIH